MHTHGRRPVGDVMGALGGRVTSISVQSVTEYVLSRDCASSLQHNVNLRRRPEL